VKLENTTIGFVGAGNMANSLIRGLLVKGCNPSSIIVADVDQAKLQILGTESEFAVAITNLSLMKQISLC
jgi:pyrroline-5-carboxylate reductase